MSSLGKTAGWILLGSVAMAGAITFADATGFFIDKEARRDKLYDHLMAKTEKVADKNSNGRMDLNEARDIIYEGNKRILPLSVVEKRILEHGYLPSVSQMQTYLRSEGKFDANTDDSPLLRERDRNWIGYLKP